MNKFLLAGDKFIPEIKKVATGTTDFIYKNELNKACFQHDMAYEKSKDLAKRTQSDKIIKDKAFKIASDPKYMVIKED